jgi:hypothetical protein
VKTDMIHINKITEHEDGSATLEVEMLQESYRKIFEYGLQMLFMKAVEDAAADNNDEEIRPMTAEERNRAKEREEKNTVETSKTKLS